MKAKWNISENWNQLTTKQLGKIGLLLLNKISQKKIDTKILTILLHVNWWQFRKQYKLVQVLKNYTLKDLKKHYAYIYEQCSRTAFIKLKKCTPPGERLNNLTVAEFSVAEDLFKLFWQTKDVTYLRCLTAVLYVPTPYPERPIFNKNKLEQLTKPFKKTSKTKLMAIMFCYMGCKNHLSKKFPLTFPEPSENEQTGKDKGFDPVIIQMSGAKFGDHQKTKNTNLYVFLTEYEFNLKQIQDANTNTGY